MSEIDELFDLKNSYYLGNFSHTVNEANKLKLSKLNFFDIQPTIFRIWGNLKAANVSLTTVFHVIMF